MCYLLFFSNRARSLLRVSEGIICRCRSPRSILIMYVVFQAAVFMRSLDSLESHPLKARETMMKKGVAVLTVSWATAGEAMDREGPGEPQCPQTLEGHTPTNEHCSPIVGSQWFPLTTTTTHCKTALFFRLVPSLRYRQAWCCVLVMSQKVPAAGAGLQPLCCCSEKHRATWIIELA